MEENYLIVLLIAFVFGFVLFKKDSSVLVEKDEKDSLLPKVTYGAKGGVTGVAKYLSKKDGTLSQEGGTGVARYLQQKQQLIADNDENSSISGVAKYLAGREEEAASGVSKYMARQAIQAKAAAKANASGVEKYLNSRGG